jgi:hypothetical protein
LRLLTSPIRVTVPRSLTPSIMAIRARGSAVRGRCPALSTGQTQESR